MLLFFSGEFRFGTTLKYASVYIYNRRKEREVTVKRFESRTKVVGVGGG